MRLVHSLLMLMFVSLQVIAGLRTMPRMMRVDDGRIVAHDDNHGKLLEGSRSTARQRQRGDGNEE